MDFQQKITLQLIRQQKRKKRFYYNDFSKNHQKSLLAIKRNELCDVIFHRNSLP